MIPSTYHTQEAPPRFSVAPTCQKVSSEIWERCQSNCWLFSTRCGSEHWNNARQMMRTGGDDTSNRSSRLLSRVFSFSSSHKNNIRTTSANQHKILNHTKYYIQQSSSDKNEANYSHCAAHRSDCIR